CRERRSCPSSSPERDGCSREAPGCPGWPVSPSGTAHPCASPGSAARPGTGRSATRSWPPLTAFAAVRGSSPAPSRSTIQRHTRPRSGFPRVQFNERRNAGMTNGTYDPEPRAAAQTGGAPGTGASLEEVSQGGKASGGVVMGAGSGSDQEELEALYRQSFQDLDEGEVVK